MKRQFNEKEVNEKASWWKGKQMKMHIYEKAIQIKRQVDEKSSRWKGYTMKRQFYEKVSQWRRNSIKS